MSDTVRFIPRSGDTWRDPYPMYAALRDGDPVHHVETGDYWVLSRFGDVFAALRDPAMFSSAQGLTIHYDEVAAAGLGEATPLVFQDPPAHTAFRRLVARRFTPRKVAAIEPMVRDFVSERVEALGARGSGDIVAELFKPLPSMVVAHFLGVPEADRERFDEWTNAIVAANAAGGSMDAPEAVGALFSYFGDLVEWRRHDPGDDTISELVAIGSDHVDGVDPVPVLRILGFAFTMVAGGNDTTTGLLGGSAELLTEYPDQRRMLLEDPELIGDAVDELLRLTSPVQGLARTTTRDVDVSGTTIPANRKVLMLYASANRDRTVFGDDAEELRVDRRPRQILSLGYGAHHCLGAAVARLVARVTLTELLARIPDFTVDAARGEFATGNYVRRYRSLPFTSTGFS